MKKMRGESGDRIWQRGNEEVTKRGRAAPSLHSTLRIRLWPQIYFLGLYRPRQTAEVFRGDTEPLSYGSPLVQCCSPSHVTPENKV